MPQAPFGRVVVRWHLRVSHKDEQFLDELFNAPAELAPSAARAGIALLIRLGLFCETIRRFLGGAQREYPQLGQGIARGLAQATRSFLADFQHLDVRRRKAQLQTILKSAYVYRDNRLELEFRG